MEILCAAVLIVAIAAVWRASRPQKRRGRSQQTVIRVNSERDADFVLYESKKRGGHPARWE